jgi:hypothetical protein
MLLGIAKSDLIFKSNSEKSFVERLIRIEIIILDVRIVMLKDTECVWKVC